MANENLSLLLLLLLLPFLILTLSSPCLSLSETSLNAAITSLRSNSYTLFGNAILTSDLYTDLLLNDSASFTLFAPTDPSLFTLDLSSRADLYVSSLRRHVAVGRLQSLTPPFPNPLPSLLPDHPVSLSLVNGSEVVAANGVVIIAPRIFYGPDLTVHGLAGMLPLRFAYSPSISPSSSFPPSIAPASMSSPPSIAPTLSSPTPSMPPTLSLSSPPSSTPTPAIAPTPTMVLAPSKVPTLSLSSPPSSTPTPAVAPTPSSPPPMALTPSMAPTLRKTPSISPTVSSSPPIFPTSSAHPSVAPSSPSSARDRVVEAPMSQFDQISMPPEMARMSLDEISPSPMVLENGEEWWCLTGEVEEARCFKVRADLGLAAPSPATTIIEGF